MQYVRENIEFEDNYLAFHRWKPDISDYKGIIQIVHGMAEHVKRYEEFAEYFTDKGFLVCGIDQLGHGETVDLNKGILGYFDKKEGWIKAVNSNKYISKILKDRHPEKPLIVFGHSMGSIITRYYLIGERIPKTLILSGIMEYKEILMDFVKVLAKLEKGLKEDTSENVIDNYLLDLIYNRKFNSDNKNNWISSLEQEVDKYTRDEKCGFKITNQMFVDMMEGIKTIDKKEKNKEISKDIPLFIIGGSDDPVSNYGSDVRKLFDKYKEANLDDVKYKLYSGVRHEVIRDKRNEDVYNDLETWINDHI